MNESNSPVVKIQNLTKKFGSLKAVDNVSLTICSGEIFGLLGPNGAGKTTLIHCCMGSYKMSGKIEILNYAIPKEKNKARKLIGFMPQEIAIYLDLTPLQNALFYGRIFRMKDKEIKRKISELFRLLALEDKANKLCRTLSGGQKRRISLGISLLTNPQILFLDEPTVGVDPVLRMEFWNYFNKLKQEGKTIIISTHITDEAMRVDRVSLMIDGKILAIGSPKELMEWSGVNTLEDLFIHYRKGGIN